MRTQLLSSLLLACLVVVSACRLGVMDHDYKVAGNYQVAAQIWTIFPCVPSVGVA
jgi:outer membrane receptor for monomeric catechols